MRTMILIGILVGVLGCGDNDASVTCGPCGDGGLNCTGPIEECIATGACETHQAGNVILFADGSYTQDNGGGAFTVMPGILILHDARSTSSALLSVEIATCGITGSK